MLHIGSFLYQKFNQFIFENPFRQILKYNPELVFVSDMERKKFKSVIKVLKTNVTLKLSAGQKDVSYFTVMSILSLSLCVCVCVCALDHICKSGILEQDWL